MPDNTKAAADEEVIVVLIEGPNGEEEYYAQDVLIPYDGKEFAILVSEDETEEEPQVIVARMDQDEDGEIVYVSPEEDEFAAVERLYNEMFDTEE